jgi:hypothetical protein
MLNDAGLVALPETDWGKPVPADFAYATQRCS